MPAAAAEGRVFRRTFLTRSVSSSLLAVPGKACNEHGDCVSNAECLMSNETRKKTCACKDGFEYDPAVDDLSCSGESASALAQPAGPATTPSRGATG